MGSEHWRREDPQFYNFMALSRGRLEEPGCVGDLKGALLSRDALSDACTFLVEVPPGFKGREDAGRHGTNI